MLNPNPSTDQIWDRDTDYLVIVNHYDNDISWSNRINFKHIIYEKNQPDKEPFNAMNKGKSETNLLKFCYEFYDFLPKNIIVVHQYERKWYHKGSLVDILNDPELENKYKACKTPGYYCINSTILYNIDEHIPKIKESGWWTETMLPWFGNIDSYHRFTVHKGQAAQFIVSRERIHSLPREFYSNMYKWYDKNGLDEKMPGINPVNMMRQPLPTDNHPLSNWYTSRYLEYTWELIFTAHKRWESIPQDLGGIYGADAYQHNVSSHLRTLVKDDQLVIPKNLRFNDIFGDTCWGESKTLHLCVNGRYYSIPEFRQDDIVISL